MGKSKCEICGEVFKTARWLEIHLANEHACKECGKILKTVSDYDQHRKTHLNITLSRDPNTHSYQRLNRTCKICEKGFATDEELEEHMLLHDRMPVLEAEEDDVEDVEEEDDDDEVVVQERDVEELMVEERELEEVVIEEEDVEVELQEVHVTKKQSGRNDKFHPEKKSKVDFPKPCDECDRVLYSLSGWVMHKKMHDRNNKLHKTAKAPAVSENDDSDYFTCKKCFKVFANRSTLKTHMKCHGASPAKSPKKTYWCDICHQGCPGAEELEAHKLEHENNSVDLTESEDGDLDTSLLIPMEQVSTMDQWSDHPDADHNDATTTPNYECEVCGKSFSAPLSLKVHRSWHKRIQRKVPDAIVVEPSPSQSFKCISCAMRFDDDTALQLHIFECHRKTSMTIERRIFRCEICDIGFALKSEYELHEMQHERPIEKRPRVTCKYCKKNFSRTSYLNMHMNYKHPQHAIAGQYKCTLCENVFDKQSALNIHLRVHEKMNGSSNNPNIVTHKYTCSICQVGFDIPKELKLHVIDMHPF
ncbi:PREDICTED: zinc finger protein 595-like [Nicrophorus vespilloides]|uniref:Zinc finger protein 595-like n=1 Tax=Nicrophorus vespilloides TaxID=110193 RepID=A0ABM1MUT3_NICVS|nr:PREDICTED: zinc finger protein 595-like [Nicrophorus vespilloides]